MSITATTIDREEFEGTSGIRYNITLEEIKTEAQIAYWVHIQEITEEFEGLDITEEFNERHEAYGFFSQYIDDHRIHYEVQLLKIPECTRNGFMLAEATCQTVAKFVDFSRAQSYFSRFCSGANDADGYCGNQNYCMARFYRIVEV